MGVGSRESEFELARSLPDHQAAYGYTTQVHLELARAGLDGQRERSSLAYSKLVAWDAAEDGRNALPGRLGLGDANTPLLLDYPGARLPVGSWQMPVIQASPSPGSALNRQAPRAIRRRRSSEEG